MTSSAICFVNAYVFGYLPIKLKNKLNFISYISYRICSSISYDRTICACDIFRSLCSTWHRRSFTPAQVFCLDSYQTDMKERMDLLHKSLCTLFCREKVSQTITGHVQVADLTKLCLPCSRHNFCVLQAPWLFVLFTLRAVFHEDYVWSGATMSQFKCRLAKNQSSFSNGTKCVIHKQQKVEHLQEMSLAKILSY